MRSFSWDSCINRCQQLAADSPSTSELLRFYTALLKTQKQIHDSLNNLRSSFADDLQQLKTHFDLLLDFVIASGPTPLAQQARALSTISDEAFEHFIIDYWNTRSDKEFFAKALLQPYAQRLAVENFLAPAALRENQCPFCLGKPQVSFLQTAEGGSESGNRHLLCATCLSSWEFRRVVCVSCGEEDPSQLSYFQTNEFEHVRIEACDSCNHYIKGVDLTRLGFAEPLVDDVATAALDLWAIEHGYTKIELNLVGI